MVSAILRAGYSDLLTLKPAASWNGGSRPGILYFLYVVINDVLCVEYHFLYYTFSTINILIM